MGTVISGVHWRGAGATVVRDMHAAARGLHAAARGRRCCGVAAVCERCASGVKVGRRSATLTLPSRCPHAALTPPPPRCTQLTRRSQGGVAAALLWCASGE